MANRKQILRDFAAKLNSGSGGANAELPDVYWGSPSDPPLDWRKQPSDDTPDDDQPLAETPPDVVALLGFDPKEFDVT